MIANDLKIESLIHRNFVDFRRDGRLDSLGQQLSSLYHSGYQLKFVDAIKGDVDGLIKLAESPVQADPEQEESASFIKQEKLAALRLLKFNCAAELASIENALDLPNQKTTATPVRLKPYTLKLYYCVFLKEKDFFILIDTNYHQFHWSLKRLIRSLITNKESN